MREGLARLSIQLWRNFVHVDARVERPIIHGKTVKPANFTGICALGPELLHPSAAKTGHCASPLQETRVQHESRETRSITTRTRAAVLIIPHQPSSSTTPSTQPSRCPPTPHPALANANDPPPSPRPAPHPNAHYPPSPSLHQTTSPWPTPMHHSPPHPSSPRSTL